MSKIIEKIKLVLKNDVLIVLPGNLAFGLMLSLVPMITLAIILAQSFGISFDMFIDKLSSVIPSEVIDILSNYVKVNGVSISNILVMLAGFVEASGAANSLIITSNLLYKEEKKNVMSRQVRAFLITILIILSIVIALIFLTLGDYIVSLLIKLFNSSNLIYIFYKVLKWPISLILLYLLISMIYILSSNKHLTLKDVSIGAIFSASCWCLVSALYTFYISNFTSYDILYGGLSTIIVLLMWLYILSYVGVLGIAINSKIVKKK